MSAPHTYTLVSDQSLSWSLFFVAAFALSPVRNVLNIAQSKRARRARPALRARGRRVA